MPYPTLAALAQAADTVVMVAGGGPLETAAAIADIVLAVLMVAFVAGLCVLLLQIRHINATVRQLGEGLQRRVDPVLIRGRVVAENVEYVSMAVRHDVEKLNESVRSLKERLDQASTRMEQRIEDFNALMEVVQSEAEDIALDTAATVRGVKAGARRLTRGRGERFDADEAGNDDPPGSRTLAADPDVHLPRRHPTGAQEAGGAD